MNRSHVFRWTQYLILVATKVVVALIIMVATKVVVALIIMVATEVVNYKNSVDSVCKFLNFA